MFQLVFIFFLSGWNRALDYYIVKSLIIYDIYSLAKKKKISYVSAKHNLCKL